MKVQKIISPQGEFAKVGEDFKEGDLITILNEGESIEGKFGSQMVFKAKVTTGEKLLNFNQTSMNNLIDAYGEDTVQWINKEAKVFVVKQMITNVLRNVCYLTGKDWTMNEDGSFVKVIDSETPVTPTATPQAAGEIKPEDIPF